MGAVNLILNQCQADKTAPLAREWGLWAIRNICEGSEEARKAIEEMKQIGVHENEDLKRAGLEVKIDKTSGRLRVSSRKNDDE